MTKEIVYTAESEISTPALSPADYKYLIIKNG